jgi:hypothetical protein
MRTAILFPTFGRVEQARRCLDGFIQTAPAATCVVVTEDDERAFGALLNDEHILFVPVTEGMTAVQKWNHALRRVHRRFDAFFLGADDLWPANGWLDEVLNVQAKTGAGCVSINDGIVNGNALGTHYLLTKDWIKTQQNGVMCVPHYRSWGLDVETTARAKHTGTYAWAERAMVEHRHVHWKKAAMDDTYRRGYLVHQYDEFILEIRRKAGFPNDFQAVIS